MLALLALCLLQSPPERYVVIPFGEIAWEGAAPEPVAAVDWDLRPFLDGYVVLDGGGEGYLESQQLALRVGAGTSGRVFLPRPDAPGFEGHRFAIPAGPEGPGARTAFLAVERAHYERLSARSLPGGAWFRHRAAAAGAPSNGARADEPWRGRSRGLDETFDLFTGNRAIAENLDLERALVGLADEQATIPVDSIQGVTTRAMDWKALVRDLHPDLDPLAALVPADQHAVFFPSFEAMTRVFDEVDQAGTPVLQLADPGVEDQRTKQRYQEQLLLPMSAVARLLGPAVVSSVAITGSDPYLASGSDLALLFECKDEKLLLQNLGFRHAEGQAKGAKTVEGSAGTLAWRGVRSADRRFSSYVASIGPTVIVSNSPAQLERIAAVAEGRATPLAKADEYVWFRDRYRRGDPAESALLVLTDATIRRWAGPRSRIGDSRRVRALAAITEVQARSLERVVAGDAPEGEKASAPDLPFAADLIWRDGAVHSGLYGSRRFLTPLAEIPVEKVTPSEKAAYERFREGFQSRWRNVFDPIALRLSVSPARLGADLTVMPLVLDSDYRDLRDLTLDAELAPTAGDAHEGTLFHVAFAFGKRSEAARFLGSGIGPFARQLGADPFAWLGDGVALYADRDPFWEELRKAPEPGPHLEKRFYDLPLALHVEVADPLKLAGFLVGVRAMADGAAPEMTRWETRTWKEQGYVAITVEEEMGLGEEAEKAALYYAAMPDALVLSLREDVVQRAIERRLARKEGKTDPARERPWLGSSLGLRAEREAAEVFRALAGEAIGGELRDIAWSALPILDEWKRRFPSEDPLVVHERVFGVRLASPGGGTYVWNEATQSMEATDYGSPAAPKPGPDLPAALADFARGEFGLGFDGEGLRVRVELERDGK